MANVHDIVRRYIKEYPNLSHLALAKKIKQDTNVRQGIQYLRKLISKLRGKFTTEKETKSGPSFEVNGDESGFKAETPKSKRIITYQDLIDALEVDLDKFKLVKFGAKKWEVGAKNDYTGHIEVEPLYGAHADFIPKSDLNDDGLFLKSLREAVLGLAPSTIPFQPHTGDKEKLLEIYIPDLHLNKKANVEDSGEEYNLKIAIELYEKVVNTLISDALALSNFEYEKIVFIVGSDFYNSDNNQDTTTKGTKVDEDVRWRRAFRTGTQIAIKAINQCAHVAPVDVIVIPGNHDEQRSFYLGEVLSAYYIDNLDVIVNNSGLKRTYYQYGKCGICFAHGDKIAQKEWPNIFATEAPQIWGNTIYREVHTGDKHHQVKRNNVVKVQDGEDIKEYRGCVFRIIRSLSATDDYHYTHGFVGAHKGAEAFVWDKERGLVNIINITL